MKKFKSIEDLKNHKPEETDSIIVNVGMSSCGIAAGADKTMAFIEEQITKMGIKNIILQKVGCLGLCFSEPNVEVIMPNMPSVLYGKVDENFAFRILEEHVSQKRIINENIYDNPGSIK